MPPSPKLSTHTTRYSPTATSAARITLTRVLESKIGQMPLVLLQYLVPDLHYCQSSVENFMTNLREAKKQGRASAGSKLEEWEGFYSGWSRYVGKVERALELKEKVSNQTFPAPKQTFSDPLFTLPSGSSSLRASEAILAEYFGRLWADWQNYQVDEEDDDDEEDEDQSYSDWKELGKEYGSKTLGEGDENVRRALRLVVDATDLLRSPTDGKQAIGTLRSALYWSKGVPVSLTTSRLFRVAGGTLASHFQNGIASEMVLEWEASRLGPVQRRIDNLVLPSARPIDSPPLSDSVRKTFGTTTAQEGAADAVLNSVYALMDPSSSTDDTVVAHHDLAAVYDLDAIQKGGSEAVAETLDEFGTFEERKKLFRLSRRLAGIEGRSGLPGERSFSPLLSTDNILIFRVMMAQAAGIVDSQTLAVVQDHLDEILLMTNAAIMSSSPSVYSLIAASKLFLVYRHIVFDHTASPSYAATKELVEELIALSSSLFVTATAATFPWRWWQVDWLRESRSW
nr:uncharacterized protein CI109_005669 [Kwoniella shandongensis]KAA5525922.1 hypothetical protein CI109_005669 [Kwoniella shandongensis]